MSDLTDAPARVLEVHNAMLANARERFGDDTDDLSPVYTRPEGHYSRVTGEYETTGCWIVACNFEGWGSSMIFHEGDWFYRSSRSGEDRLMKGGHEEALANASIFFTG